MSQSDAEFGPNKYIKNEDMMGGYFGKNVFGSGAVAGNEAGD